MWKSATPSEPVCSRWHANCFHLRHPNREESLDEPFDLSSLLGEFRDVSLDRTGADFEATLTEALAIIPSQERVIA